MSEIHSLGSVPLFIFSNFLPETMLIVLAALAIFGLFQLARATLTSPELKMALIRWIELILFVGAAFAIGFLIVAANARAKEKQAEKLHDELQAALTHQQQLTAKNEKERTEYVLEIINLGISLDKHRQNKVWDALQKGGPYSSIRELDPKKYAWSDTDKMGISGGRILDAFENAAKSTPMYWGLPSFYAGAPSYVLPKDPVMGLAGNTQGTGLSFHLWVNGAWKLAERPDRLLEQVFDFFDQYPDVPFVVLTADDSYSYRDQSLPPGTPSLVKDGYYVPAMPDAAAVFILARRERVEPLRPYAWYDLDDNFLQWEFRQMYYKLMDSIPTNATYGYGTKIARPPTSTEWLHAAAVFAKNPEAHPEGHDEFLTKMTAYRNKPPKSWKPTPWFPIPWTSGQLSAFDSLPTLGYLHRPVFIPFRDADGNPVKRRDQRQQIIMAGWQQALQTLPDSGREKGPARIIAGTNNNKDQLIMLTTMLHQYEHAGGPAFDITKTAQFIDTDRRLGNTGAATFFMQMALGMMGSYKEGGVSAAINLRDPDEASIVLISPAPDEKRRLQRDPFVHDVQPQIDPDNYKAPSVEALLQAQQAGVANK
ncbi:hypothetical protein GCM10027277_17300 [Pseudoduganella ginsengisoli]|uniref:DUF2875 domain-containing protein n=1 Tax=Pseudoduganella ginsengisoli TaxID=1462440 RepID=A0A6L6PVH5_9BURK|nr:DUF2875 family protein [Pseudoduganella ginsengisoli]MTW01008.1 DUF2875 domain-containing protein [Pseudoduganella ginsengisoli]